MAINPRDVTLVAAYSDRFLRYWDLDIGTMVSLYLVLFILKIC